MSIPYPPKNCIITFREPFPRVEYSPGKKYYIRVCCGQLPEQEIRMDATQQLDVIDYLIQIDRKLTNAVVRNDSQGRFVVLQHSPQEDFFSLVKGK